jgi:ElaB/YqjD/DUF883 family membrane-anchored ribosome-binding protein
MAKDRSRADEIAGDVRDRAEAAFDHAHTAIEDGLDEAHRYMRRQWRERPLAVAATALGVGLLAGLFIGSRR